MIALAVFLLLAVALVALVARQGSAPIVQGELYQGVEGEGRLLGSPDAPLLIKDFSDFRCPHCRTAATELIPEIIRNYIAEGKVRLEFVPVAVLGRESILAAEGALCAEEQGAFWEYHDQLFSNQTAALNEEALISYASETGLESNQFRNCLMSHKYRDQVEENNQAFQRAGGEGTPTFLVGDELVAGAVPFSQMQPVIEAQLGQ